MKVYDNRLTLWNAGKLPDELTIEQLFQVHESIPRNPLLAEVCYKAGYIDSWDRGVEKISDACQAAKLPAPQFIERSGGMVVELNRSLPKSSVKVVEKVGEKVGENLTDNQKMILKILSKNPCTSARQLSDLIGISARKIEVNLRKLKAKSILKRVGPAKGGHWEIIDE